MTLSAFPYVGGKTRLVDWILQQLPAHTTYVEPFGGSAAVLLNKPRSPTEVYNDRDSDVVQFFEVARRRPDALAEWCRRTPFSEELHARWVDAFYQGDRPADPVARAGRWLFLRYSQYAGKVARPSGFKRESPADPKGAREARNWASVPERVESIAARFTGVSILNADATEVVDRYDAPSTVFYCDPPYLDKADYYPETVDHDALATSLQGIDGYALVSYTELPPGYDDWTVLARQATHRAGGTNKQVTERLLCNFDPETEPRWSHAHQTRLDQWRAAT